MRAVVTGGRGFVGQHLVQHLKRDLNMDVFEYNLSDGHDLRDAEDIRNFLDNVRPDYIFHLAAQAFVAESFTNVARTFEVNTIGSANLFEAVKRLGFKVKIQVAGTAEEYGDAADDIITEETLPNPQSPYAISKLAMTNLAMLYNKAYGMHIVVTRAFNHTGPGRGEQYAESSFAKQVAEVEVKKRKILTHGNLVSIRNYTDVRDMVKAYAIAIELEPSIYNICSHQNVSMRDVLDELIEQSPEAVPYTVNQALLRPSDFSFHPPSNKKFVEASGWDISIPLKQTMRDLLNYWRERV